MEHMYIQKGKEEKERLQGEPKCTRPFHTKSPATLVVNKNNIIEVAERQFVKVNIVQYVLQ